jgi:hypothetical protein
MPDVETERTHEVRGITLDERTMDGVRNPFYVYRRDWGLDLRFEYDGYWHRGEWRYRRGQIPLITHAPEAWNTLDDAVQAAIDAGLITHTSSMPTSRTGTDMEGHLREYHVRDRREDGSLITESWNAQHLDTCACITDPESWY